MSLVAFSFIEFCVLFVTYVFPNKFPILKFLTQTTNKLVTKLPNSEYADCKDRTGRFTNVMTDPEINEMEVAESTGEDTAPPDSQENFDGDDVGYEEDGSNEASEKKKSRFR